VLEAVASGLPVAGFDSGSMKELVYFNSDLLAEVSDDTFQSYDQFDSQKLAEKIVESVKNYDEYRKLALEHCNEYSFTQVGEKYIQVFNDQLEN
jgi:glycosyltransferase involved in cell wall biosynthesis